MQSGLMSGPLGRAASRWSFSIPIRSVASESWMRMKRPDLGTLLAGPDGGIEPEWLNWARLPMSSVLTVIPESQSWGKYEGPRSRSAFQPLVRNRPI